MPSHNELRCSLSNDDIARYSRQILVPSFGPANQQALRCLSVLIVGAGGLGCPVALYLAGAGVGRLGIVDHDVVDASNLHRQIAHTESRVGEHKAVSLATAVRDLNSSVQVHPHVARLTAETALELVSPYDCVVDCTDNPATRYLINDACVLAGRPLVSGAAVGMDGQISVYGLDGGPCYRCLHPVPPAMVQSCSDAGVLGPIVGVIGCLQALEVMKIAGRLIAKKASSHATLPAAKLSEESASDTDEQQGAAQTGFGDPLMGRLLAFDGADARFRVVRLRARSPDCAVCGDTPSIEYMAESGSWCEAHGLVAQEASMHVPPPACACGGEGAPAAAWAVPEVSVRELASIRASAAPRLILDCRAPVQFSICALRGSVSMPLARLQYSTDSALSELGLCAPRAVSGLHAVEQTPTCGGDAPLHSGIGGETCLTAENGASDNGSDAPRPSVPRSVYVVCRRGVDSVTATRLLREQSINAFNVAGGLQAWAREVDSDFPVY